MQRSPRNKHVVNDAAELLKHVAIKSVEPLVVAVRRNGFVRSIESIVESIGRRIVELIGFRQIVIRQLEHATVEQSIRKGQGQEQVIAGPPRTVSERSLIASN